MNKFFILISLMFLALFAAKAQCPGPAQRTNLINLQKSQSVESTLAGQIPLTDDCGNLRYAQYVEIENTPVGFIPNATGNTSNFSEFVIASDSTRWYIDWQGRGYLLGAGATSDKNGYYGGNGGNGGDATIPSVTKSTLTNQLTFLRATDDSGGLVPIRIQVDAGNEPDFLSFKNLTDSLLISRSDQDFVINSSNGLSIIASQIMGLSADSIQISTVPNNFTGERTFLTLSPNNTITKQEGINQEDFNFTISNIYNSNGSLNSNRTLDGNGKNFIFSNAALFDFSTTNTFDLLADSSVFIGSGTNISLTAGGNISLVGDSVNIAAVPNNFSGEKTFLTYSPGGFITKQEGISETDLNFPAPNNANAGLILEGNTVKLGNSATAGVLDSINIRNQTRMISASGSNGAAAIVFNENGDFSKPFVIFSANDSTNLALAMQSDGDNTALMMNRDFQVVSTHTSADESTTFRLNGFIENGFYLQSGSENESYVVLGNSNFDGVLLRSQGGASPISNDLLLHWDSTSSTKKIIYRFHQTTPDTNELITRQWAEENIGGSVLANQGLSTSGDTIQLGSTWSGTLPEINISGQRSVTWDGTNGAGAFVMNADDFGAPFGIFQAADSASLNDLVNGDYYSGSGISSYAPYYIEMWQGNDTLLSNLQANDSYFYMSSQNSANNQSSNIRGHHKNGIRSSVSYLGSTNIVEIKADSTTYSKKAVLTFTQTTPTQKEFITRQWAEGAFSISGTYVPTRSAEVNMDANVAMTTAQYSRTGNVVSVSGLFTADPTTTSLTTSFEFSLPISSNLAAVEDAAGTAFCGTVAGMGAAVYGVVANDKIKVSWISTDVASQTWSYILTYQVK